MTGYIGPFSGPYRFLSNFYIEPDGSHVEGEYQSRKTDPTTDSMITMPPAQAKKVGRKIRLRPDWERVKVGIMRELVFHKFMDHPSLKAALKATGDAYLDEVNWWGDTFWGTVDGVGSNELGKILMWVRSTL